LNLVFSQPFGTNFKKQTPTDVGAPVFLSLKWPGSLRRSTPDPRQVIRPYCRAYGLTGHLKGQPRYPCTKSTRPTRLLLSTRPTRLRGKFDRKSCGKNAFNFQTPVNLDPPPSHPGLYPQTERRHSKSFLGPLGSSSSQHRRTLELICRKAKLPFGSHQAPRCKGSSQANRGEYLTQIRSWQRKLLHT
jgi:hypothetical protein